MWHVIASRRLVPSLPQVRLAVIDNDDVRALVFLCDRIDDHWIHADTKIEADTQIKFDVPPDIGVNDSSNEHFFRFYLRKLVLHA
jgi:hypothetical protein